jgi:hypothetical protein
MGNETHLAGKNPEGIPVFQESQGSTKDVIVFADGAHGGVSVDFQLRLPSPNRELEK